MNKAINRRDFLKYAGYASGGLAVLVVGSKMPWALKDNVYAQSVQTLDFHITDIMKEMHTHNFENTARCYFWTYRSVVPALLPECPGPIIMAARGETVHVKVTNDLDEPHAFAIPQLGVNSGPILPGQVWEGDIAASQCGSAS